jgi:hypothetical protein
VDAFRQVFTESDQSRVPADMLKLVGNATSRTSAQGMGTTHGRGSGSPDSVRCARCPAARFERVNHAAGRGGGIGEHVEVPDPDDDSSLCLKLAFTRSSRHVPGDLRVPVRPAPAVGQVVGVPVPPDSVDEDGDTPPREREVGGAAHLRVTTPPSHAPPHGGAERASSGTVSFLRMLAMTRRRTSGARRR